MWFVVDGSDDGGCGSSIDKSLDHSDLLYFLLFILAGVCFCNLPKYVSGGVFGGVDNGDGGADAGF